ncbi:DEAD box RNA helicase-PL10B [Diaporthe helianthi]|uniref:RNA helicase n=1 Tax=Diaporthe helianthi TaxID=158607 RepID=A0A2P5I5D2_DIAHE|nr:DEAD box RNA helicase-PL10B [Diaporthe helianthi]
MSSGWGTQDASGSGWGSAQEQNNGAFDTGSMANALPDTNGHAESRGDSGNPPTNDQAADGGSAAEDTVGGGWAPSQKYDYDQYADSRGGDFDGNKRVYYWDGQEGEIGPVFPELEVELFGPADKRELPSGIDFSSMAPVDLEMEGPVQIRPIANFSDAGLHPAMVNNLDKAQYKTPTPIQKYCLPAIKQGFDVIGIAQTGSGKTAAYLIPILDKLMGKAKKLAAPRPNPSTFKPGIDPPVRAEPLVCIVVPTRELAIQIFMEARKFCYRSMLRPCAIYGGGPIRDQIEQLSKGCDILVASPGRLLDFIDRPDILTLRRLKFMVIDEADEMLHDDWREDFGRIIGGGEQEEGNIQYLLFSATFPKRVRELAMTHLATEHVRFRVGRAGRANDNIVQNVVQTDPSMKRQAMYDLLHSMPPARTLIFVNNKRTADELDDFLFNRGLPCTSIHADRTQLEREDAMRAFRKGSMPIMIATGVSARGIDVRNVCHVINFDLPSNDHGGIEEYTHRIGRTGRIGNRGLATSFYTERDEPLAPVLVRTLLETKQAVPEFLQQFLPEGEELENLQFPSEQDDDLGGMDAGAWGDNAGGDSGDAWGGEAETSATGGDTGNAWGGAGGTSAAASGGWEAGGSSTGGGGW